jgi:hypothetical protein
MSYGVTLDCAVDVGATHGPKTPLRRCYQGRSQLPTDDIGRINKLLRTGVGLVSRCEFSYKMSFFALRMS